MKRIARHTPTAVLFLLCLAFYGCSDSEFRDADTIVGPRMQVDYQTCPTCRESTGDEFLDMEVILNEYINYENPFCASIGDRLLAKLWGSQLKLYDHDDGSWGAWGTTTRAIRVWSGHWGFQGVGSSWQGWRTNLAYTLVHEGYHDLVLGGDEGSADDAATTCVRQSGN